MLRWFRMVYHWFFGGTFFCAPVLMTLYFLESSAIAGENSDVVLGMKRITIAATNNSKVFWVVVAEMWLLSIWLIHLLGRESEAYSRLCWKLSPSKVGIKSHAVVVNDIPQLTTKPIPEELRRLRNGQGDDLMHAINLALLPQAQKSPESKAVAATAAAAAETGRTDSGVLPSLPPLEEGALSLPPFDRNADLGRAGGGRLRLDGREESNASAESVEGEGKAWLERNLSEVRSFMNDVADEDMCNVRACTSGEIEAAVRGKLEGVLGKGCVVSCMLARDTRQLDKVAETWHATHNHHLQVLIRENNLKEAIKETEAAAGGGAVAAAQDGGESGGVAAASAASVGGGGRIDRKTTSGRKLAKLRTDLGETVTLRDKLREAVRESLLKFDNARSAYLNDMTPSPTAVVVFSRQMDAVIASQVQLDHHFGQWQTEAAAGPNDLVWHNVALTSRQRRRKNMRARAIASIIVLFFMVPVNGCVWALSQARQSIVDSLGNAMWIVLVGLVLTIFLVLGHIVSLVLSRQYGHISKSKMDVSGASIYFWLLVFNLYLGNLNDRPVWDDLLDWIKDPHLVLHQLIMRTVETSTFFLQFCMLRVAQSCPLELIHPPFHLGFLVKTVLHRVRSHQMPTRKMILTWTQPENTPLHRVPAQTMTVFFLGCMYCVMAPFFLPVCGIFFALFYLFYKHNLCPIPQTHNPKPHTQTPKP